MESFSYSENGKVPEYVLVQEVLSRALEKEQVIEIVDYDFFGPYFHGQTLQDRVIPKSFPLGIQNGHIEITSSQVNQRTHNLSLSKIPEESRDKIFLLGFPYEDTTRYDEAISEIDSMESDENSDIWSNRLNESYDTSPPIPSFYGDDIATMNRKTEKWHADFQAYNERQDRKREQQYQEDSRISDKYQRMRDRVNIESVIRTNTAFFRPEQTPEQPALASVDFWTNVSPASLYIPYNPLSFEDFKDKTLMQVFLGYLTKENQNIDKWAEYFVKNQMKFPIQPRLAIMSKIQTLGGKIE